MSEQLKYKMYNHEVVPPVDIWNAIQDELEGQRSYAPVAGKIYAYEVPPPPGAWQQIAAVLDNKDTPVRNISNSRPLRWIAAAAIVVFLASGAYYFFNSGNNENSKTESAALTTSADQPGNAVPLAGNLPARKTKTVSTYAVEKTLVSRKKERPLHSSRIEDTYLITDEEVVIHPHQILGESGEPIHDMSVVNPSNDKYISITAPNGQQTKISSKLAIAMPYLGYLSDDGHSITESNWKHLIEEWRARIMQSGFVPSSGNFLDILEFTELIKD